MSDAIPWKALTPGGLITSNLAPIQKMTWADYKVLPGTTYTYEVIPVYGKPEQLRLDETRKLELTISTETNEGQSHGIFFTRAVIASQAYVRKFGLTSPARPEILDWLARDMDDSILFIAGALDHQSNRTAS